MAPVVVRSSGHDGEVGAFGQASLEGATAQSAVPTWEQNSDPSLNLVLEFGSQLDLDHSRSLSEIPSGYQVAIESEQ